MENRARHVISVDATPGGNLVLAATAGIRVFTGALTGAVLAALDDDPQVPARLDKISQAIDYLGTGFPLAARPPATTP